MFYKMGYGKILLNFKLFMIITILSFLSSIEEVSSRDIDYCYANNDQPNLKFATKTAYHFVRGGKNRYQTVPNCQPLQIWMILKHGTRYPSSDKIPQMLALPKLRDQIIYNHDNRGNGHLCETDLENLKRWRLDPDLRQGNAEELTEQGKEDLNLLARRTKTNFPELFPPVISEVSSRNYVFKAADGERMRSSIENFMSGLLDRSDLLSVQESTNNTIFASNRGCPKWETEVGSNADVLKEVNRFSEGPEFTNLLYNVSRRIGFLNNITRASVNVMWDMCRYDKAWRVGVISPWCAVFSDEELRVLEYEEDLTEYYKRGYGNELNLRLGCPLLKDMFRNFEKLEGSERANEPKGVFYIARSSDLELFLTAMGVAKDDSPLLSSNYQSMSRRQWKTSEIASFAGNLAAVFYKCQDDRSPNKVIFYLAEKPLSYEGCQVGLCDWEYLKNKFQKTLSDCGSDFCNTNGAICLQIVSSVLIWLAVPALIIFNY